MIVELCPTCKAGKKVSGSMQSEDNVTIEEIIFSCGHKHVNLTIEEKIALSSISKLKTESKERLRGKPAKEVEHVIKPSGYQLRHVKTRGETETHVLQIGWENFEIDTIHCKACDNDWKKIRGRELSAQFDVKEVRKRMFRIRCKRCGCEAMSG